MSVFFAVADLENQFLLVGIELNIHPEQTVFIWATVFETIFSKRQQQKRCHLQGIILHYYVGLNAQMITIPQLLQPYVIVQKLYFFG